MCVCILDMIRDWELYGVNQEIDPQVKLQKIAEAERILGWMKNLDLSSKEPLATDESSEAHECEFFLFTSNWILLVRVYALIQLLPLCVWL